MAESQPLSIISLISEASLLVQLVMLCLFMASVVSWVMIVKHGRYQGRASRLFARFDSEFWSSGTELSQRYRDGNANAQAGTVEGAEHVFRAGFKEFSRLRQQSLDADTVMEGTQRAMRVALAREEDKLDQHLSFLATVASVSPYVGLFGTVWGIMNSFRGLANVHQATLATVAPGISEALVATAMGLFAAIPAVLAYNRFSATSERLVNHYTTFAEEFTAYLHRQLHHKG